MKKNKKQFPSRNSSFIESPSHDSALTHVTGKSEYIEDKKVLGGEVHLELFLSPHAHAEIINIEIKDALESEGVMGIYTASDFSSLYWGTIFQDQPLLAKDFVQYVGEPIVIVVAQTKHLAKLAVGKIKIQFKVRESILTIDNAISKKSFFGNMRTIQRSDLCPDDPIAGLSQAFAQSPHILEGSIILRGAEHFYLENQACIAYPKEGGQIEIHSSSQHPTEVQHVVAHALGIPYSDVTCIVKRMGGAFGGKESQAAPFAAYTALVAHDLGVPARIVLTKDDDMLITGKRNPFQNTYRVGFNDQGKIIALEVQLYSDGGAYADLSTAIMERAMLHCDNAYYLPNVLIKGQVCKTHQQPHTAFRGFGGPKGVATIEKIMEEISDYLNRLLFQSLQRHLSNKKPLNKNPVDKNPVIDALDIRKLNCYSVSGKGSITPYGQDFKFNYLPTLFETLETQSEYRKRRSEIDVFNRTQSKALRGLSLTAVKFGISFTTRFLNQANALIHIHRDGSIQISTGATEMGQGVNTRIAQIVAEEFGIALDRTRVMPTSTEKNANTSPTAASSGTDLNGAAALQAAKLIKMRLIKVAEEIFKKPKNSWARHTAGLGTEKEITDCSTKGETNETADLSSHPVAENSFEFKLGKVKDLRTGPSHGQTVTFAELCNEAYLNRISLSEYSHFKFPGLSFNKITGQGDAFFYFTQGVAASEVEIDQYTGEVKVRRVDILMDLGRPINTALDIGQVEGAFVQGMGWMTTEKLYYDAKGGLKTISPSTYKIPNIQDTPREFYINLIDNPTNTKNVRGTKAVGEPPLLLSISVYTAICDALKHLPSRTTFDETSSQSTAPFPIEIPSTSEIILQKLRPEFFN